MILILISEVCKIGDKCMNEVTQEIGICKDSICHPREEREIFGTETCNGTKCHCCTKNSKNLLSISISD